LTSSHDEKIGGTESEYLRRRRGALEQHRVGAIDGGGGLAPHAADPAAAGVDPVERVGDPRPPLDEHPDVPHRRHLLAPRAAGYGRRVRGDLGADAGAPDGRVPVAERGEEGGEGGGVAGADGVERGGETGGGGGGERGGGGQLVAAGEEEEQDGGGGEHRGHVVDALPDEHRGLRSFAGARDLEKQQQQQQQEEANNGNWKGLLENMDTWFFR
jgi:hypothetical protein